MPARRRGGPWGMATGREQATQSAMLALAAKGEDWWPVEWLGERTTETSGLVKVVIVGGGFAGLFSARALHRGRPRPVQAGRRLRG